MFTSLDTNGDGLLSPTELRLGLGMAGLKDIPEYLENIIELVTSDGNGKVNYTEFLAATLDKKIYHDESVLWEAFRVFDRNGDGKISKGELTSLVNEGSIEGVLARDVHEIMLEIDLNGDGDIDFQEFMQMMR